MTADAFPPGLILILAAVPAALLRGRLRQAWMLLVPALSLCNMLALPDGNHFLLPFFRQELVLARVGVKRLEGSKENYCPGKMLLVETTPQFKLG